jgi:hypothetical protein
MEVAVFDEIEVIIGQRNASIRILIPQASGAGSPSEVKKK